MIQDKKFIIKSYRFSEQTDNFIQDLKNKWGLENEVEVLRMIIKVAHAKEFPEYVQVIKQRQAVTPVDKAMAKEEAIEHRAIAKRSLELQKLGNICQLMDGTLLPHPDNGQPACRYTTYEQRPGQRVEKTIVTDWLDNLNDETPTFQYRTILGKTGPEARVAIEKLLANPPQD